MTPKLPESSFIEPPHKVEGTPKEARASFYELAEDKIKYLNEKEFKKWQEENCKKPNFLTKAVFVIGFKKGDNLNKWIHHLEIVINKDGFNIDGKDYSDILPFVVEHEIYEAWLSGKRGTGPKLSIDKKHLLALRKEYLLAEQQGLGDKLLEWTKSEDPDNIKNIKQSEYALQAARKQLGHLRSKDVGGKK